MCSWLWVVGFLVIIISVPYNISLLSYQSIIISWYLRASALWSLPYHDIWRPLPCDHCYIIISEGDCPVIIAISSYLRATALWSLPNEISGLLPCDHCLIIISASACELLQCCTCVLFNRPCWEKNASNTIKCRTLANNTITLCSIKGNIPDSVTNWKGHW
jgi:hypothetical protein